MTGIAFGHVLKMKEIDDSKFSYKKDDKEKQEQKGAKQIKNTPINEKARFANMWINKMMLDAYGS